MPLRQKVVWPRETTPNPPKTSCGKNYLSLFACCTHGVASGHTRKFCFTATTKQWLTYGWKDLPILQTSWPLSGYFVLCCPTQYKYNSNAHCWCGQLHSWCIVLFTGAILPIANSASNPGAGYYLCLAIHFLKGFSISTEVAPSTQWTYRTGAKALQ